ncbi:hypothetical protein IQ266_10070 [filamentous cyanobacterium LEGE 11480]|uniref:Uncharacterized protein n=1 Tax=Romeriopsis navalis LEGE 11480 TaxID=2777977 RepID=A0A928VK38_9CYAN|nr:hypothetical protein [Romeriopsis navalis]MBE9030073.1 hypothetical protein [Romeriopsis navalis LEGE 11480]
MTKRTWLTALATLTFILSMLCGYGLHAQETPPAAPSPTTSASPTASPTASPSPTTAEPVPVSPLPGSATEYNPPTPSPTAVPSPGASPLPLPGGLPTQTFPLAPPVTPIPAAKPLPTAGEFSDPSGRFRIAILEDYRVSSIGDAVLIENKTGALAYTALAQPATGGLLAPENLAEIAKTVFQRGEGFQAGSSQQIPGGAQLDWSGSLTIGGNTQPVNGVIIAKPTGTQVLLLLIAATESGANQVPNAAATLIDSFQAIQ